MFLGGTSHIFEIALSLAMTSIGQDAYSIGKDIATGNAPDLVATMANMVYHVVSGILNGLSEEQLIGLALTRGLWGLWTLRLLKYETLLMFAGALPCGLKSL